jgi:hypothetical protein
MAENEYLDSSKARRWMAVAEGVRDDIDLDELIVRVRDRFHKTLKVLFKDVPFPEIVEASNDIQKLTQICNGIDGATDVKDFLFIAAKQSGDRVQFLERFFTDALDRCLHDIPYLAARLSSEVNISDGRRAMQSVQRELRPEIARLANKFAENPAWKLQRQRAQANSITPTDNTEVMLKESLIAGFRS